MDNKRYSIFVISCKARDLKKELNNKVEQLFNDSKTIKGGYNMFGYTRNNIQKQLEELEKELYYILEENVQLRRVIREGQEAEYKLEENEKRTLQIMDEYLNIKEVF